MNGHQTLPVKVQVGDHHGGDFGLLVLALLLQALFIGLVVLLTLLVASRFLRSRKPWRAAGAMAMPGPRSAALDELELRYARGDIGRDDYLARRADLAASAPSWGPPTGYGPPMPAGPPPPMGRPAPSAPPPPSAPQVQAEPPVEPPPAPPAD